MTTMDSFESLSALEHDLRHCASWRIGWRGSIHWKLGVLPSDHHGDRPGSKFTCWNMLKHSSISKINTCPLFMWTCAVVMSEAQIEVWSVFIPVRFHFCYKNIFEIEHFFLAYLHRGGHNSTKELVPFGSMHWNMSCISKDHTVIAMAKHHHFRKFTQYHTWCWWNKKCFQGPHSQNHRDVRTKLVKKTWQHWSNPEKPWNIELANKLVAQKMRTFHWRCMMNQQSVNPNVFASGDQVPPAATYI